jgi:hypothetical protein
MRFFSRSATGLAILKNRSILAPLQAALNGKVLTCEACYRIPGSGNEIWLEMNCVPWRKGLHGIVGGIAVVKDISAQAGRRIAVY